MTVWTVFSGTPLGTWANLKGDFDLRADERREERNHLIGDAVADSRCIQGHAAMKPLRQLRNKCTWRSAWHWTATRRSRDRTACWTGAGGRAFGFL